MLPSSLSAAQERKTGSEPAIVAEKGAATQRIAAKPVIASETLPVRRKAITPTRIEQRKIIGATILAMLSVASSR
jgi:hypothetical protein